MKISLRRLPQSRIRSTAPSRREPCDVRSSTDKNSCPLFSGGPRPSPTGLCVDFELYLFPNSPINPNLKSSPYIRASPRPKRNGPTKETPTADGFCHRQILGTPPQAWVLYVRTLPIGRQKTFSQKGFCGAFSLKKRPSAPAGAPINLNLPQKCEQNVKYLLSLLHIRFSCSILVYIIQIVYKDTILVTQPRKETSHARNF